MKFTPITVELTINTKEEYDALQSAERNLVQEQITGGYAMVERNVWINTLDAIAQAARSESVAEEQVEPWYLTIPEEGIPCWVADYANVLKNEIREDDSRKIRIVYGYIASDELPFHSFDTKWKLAVPVDIKLRLTQGCSSER